MAKHYLVIELYDSKDDHCFKDLEDFYEKQGGFYFRRSRFSSVLLIASFIGTIVAFIFLSKLNDPTNAYGLIKGMLVLGMMLFGLTIFVGIANDRTVPKYLRK